MGRNRRNHKQEENQNKNTQNTRLGFRKEIATSNPQPNNAQANVEPLWTKAKKSNRTTHTQERRKQTEWNTKHDGSITNDESRGWKEFDAGEKSHSPTSPTSKRRRGTETAT